MRCNGSSKKCEVLLPGQPDCPTVVPPRAVERGIGAVETGLLIGKLSSGTTYRHPDRSTPDGPFNLAEVGSEQIDGGPERAMGRTPVPAFMHGQVDDAR
jgi:hypothetical protein